MTILHGCAIDKLKEFPDNHFDAVVTDPPYGWRFMGKAWDGADIEKKARQARRPGDTYVGRDGCTRKTREMPAEAAGKYDLSLTGNRAFQVFTEEWAREVFRVLKPGGHMLVFCGPRTYHRMAAGVEDAGFEIRDQLQWLFGSGFPKSHDISKAIDKAAGAEREVVGKAKRSQNCGNDGWDRPWKQKQMAELGGSGMAEFNITAPATDAAKQWQGWGTALKPANEPIVLARKPLEKGLTIAQNVMKWGVGALNIDGARIGTEQIEKGRAGRDAPQFSGKYNNGQIYEGKSAAAGISVGRWPANLILDEAAAEMLDAQSGVSKSNIRKTNNPAPSPTFGQARSRGTEHSDTGGASRFFYVAKASKRERNAGLEGMPKVTARSGMGGKMPIDDDGKDRDRFSVTQANHHPTVKPVKLMEYLVRLVTPPGGIVLDPFTGSGTTGVAARSLGFEFVGIEREKEYCRIAEKRIESLAECLDGLE